MALRHLALYALVAGLSIYAWKDWFKSLCALILMTAIIEHSDMPKTMLGIQGLNMWNVLFVMVALPWAASRSREGLVWDMPRHINVLLLMFLVVLVIGVLRAIADRSYIQDYPLTSLISEELINTIKWTLPALLLFDGCRTRRRVMLALVCTLAMYFIVAVQVSRFMPPVAAFGDGEVLSRSRIRLGRYIGFSAVDISAMLAGASWAVLAALPLIRQKKFRLLGLIVAGIVAYGQALSGGRAGFLAWGATGLVMCLLKWRKYLILAPIIVILLPVVFPAATARMLSGFGQVDASGETVVDEFSVTSGRAEVWPHVIELISKSPVVGYGRLGMRRTGLARELSQQGLPGFSHPHNLYLITLLDNGIIGALPIVFFWGILISCAAVLFRSGNRLYSAVGGLALSLMLAQAFAGIGSQYYYPKISTLGIWTSAFLMLRVYIEEKRARIGMAVREFRREEALEQTVTISAGAY